MRYFMDEERNVYTLDELRELFPVWRERDASDEEREIYENSDIGFYRLLNNCTDKNGGLTEIYPVAAGDKKRMLDCVKTIAAAVKELSGLCSNYNETIIDNIISDNFPFHYSLEETAYIISDWAETVENKLT